MKPLNRTYLLLIPLILLFSSIQVDGQDWKKIIPLRTNCEEIKQLFNVQTCEYPVFEITRKEFVATIVFANDQEYRTCARDTVIRVQVNFRVLPRLRLFEPAFADFDIRPDSDISNGKLLTNKRRGTTIAVQNILTENTDLGEYNVTSIDLFPRHEQKKCLSPKKNRIKD